MQKKSNFIYGCDADFLAKDWQSRIKVKLQTFDNLITFRAFKSWGYVIFYIYHRAEECCHQTMYDQIHNCPLNSGIFFEDKDRREVSSSILCIDDISICETRISINLESLLNVKDAVLQDYILFNIDLFN